ncbi:hypothetical protein JVU11DRAFT_12720 [Chiua virens]|nr:hypothetical protein JVU11DRAFT_12720 [Chiua virens]
MLVETVGNIAGKYVKSLYLFLSQAKNVFRSARQVGRAQVQQDHAATPASNCLIRDPDLSLINCGYLADYHIIVCLNAHNGHICGYGIPLAVLFIHCWGPHQKGVSVTLPTGSPHKIQFCKKRHGGHGRSSFYTLNQKQFLQRILARYPNVVVSVQEMRDLRMREDQFGPIAHIGPPVPGYACNYCEFAINDPNKGGPEPLSMREHRQQHRRAEPDEYAQLARGIDLRRSQEFHSCLVQSLIAIDAIHSGYLFFQVQVPRRPSRNNPLDKYSSLAVNLPSSHQLFLLPQLQTGMLSCHSSCRMVPMT